MADWQGNIFGTNMARYEVVRVFEDAANAAYRDGDTTLSAMFDRFALNLSSGGEHLLLDSVQFELDRDPEFYNDLMDYLPRELVVGIAGN